nr:hypothetical protein [Tanacetum cinerariifolium]
MNRLLLSLALLFYTTVAFGQDQLPPPAKWQDKFFNSPETVIPILIDAALKYSAQIENLNIAKQVALANQHLEKKRILSGLSVGSAYTYGSVYNVVDPTRPGGGINPFGLPTQSLYNV